MREIGPFGRILRTLGDLLDDGLLNGSNAVKRVAEKSWHLTHGVSREENMARVKSDDLFDLYKKAMSNKRRGEIHGNPEMDRLNMFLAERQMTLGEFEVKYIKDYKKVGR